MNDPQSADSMDDGVRIAESLLATLGLTASPLESASGRANQVWLAPTHVIRLSSGRFRDSLLHEANALRLLPPEIPHAAVVGHGRIGDREWLVLERVPGVPLIGAWSSLSRNERAQTVRQLGEMLKVLHQISLPTDFRNPWLDDALADRGERRDAYHAPPRRYRALLKAASTVSGVDPVVLGEVGAYIAERLDIFPAESEVLVHSDLHFANIMWDRGHISALLDFEGARPAPPDQELDTLLRFAREPELYCWPGSAVNPSKQDLADLPDWLADAYPALFAHRHLAERLGVYEALWQLVQLLHFPPGIGRPDPWGHLLTLLENGDAWSWRAQ